MRIVSKLLLVGLLTFNMSAMVAAEGKIFDVDQIIRQLARVKAPAKKTYPVKKIFQKKSNYHSPTKAYVNFETKHKPGSIVIKTAEMKIYFVDQNGRAIQYGIAVGSTEGRRWKGSSFISRKRVDPIWIPTASILRENPTMKRLYKPGPSNPLGVRAMNLANTPTLRIHGTNQPWTIGTAVSHGCFRMRNVDVLDLFDRVKLGARVFIES